MRGVVSLSEKYPASFRHIVEHDAIDFMACIDGSARVVIDDVLPRTWPAVPGSPAVPGRSLRGGVPAAPGAELIDVWINDN